MTRSIVICSKFSRKERAISISHMTAGKAYLKTKTKLIPQRQFLLCSR